MNIKDYAKDVNLSVAEVLRKCDELGIKADGNSILSDDDIIMIDNTINLISTDKETTYEEEDQIDDVVEKLIPEGNVETSQNKLIVTLRINEADKLGMDQLQEPICQGNTITND